MIKIPSMLMVGARRKADGKTTFTCTVTERFSSKVDVVGVKISTIDSVNASHHPDVTESNLPSRMYCISEEKERSGHTDTARMLKAGAGKVLWLQAMNAHLGEGIAELANHLDDETVSICESNRARREIEPGVFVMIRSPQEADWKPSAQEVAEHADRIIVSNGAEFDIDWDDLQLLGGRWTIRMQATAIILAGGDSTRMGQDKTMLPVGGQPIIEHIYRQLDPWFSQILISANDAFRYSFLGATVVQDDVVGRGPLMGITSALKASTNDVNFVTACDIPEIDIDLVRAMLRQARGYDAVVPRVGPGKYEPVFAVYRKNAVKVFEQALRSRCNRIVDALSHCNVKYIDLSRRQVKNINTMCEYRRFIEETTNAGN